jgi:hypothetical protein
MTFPLLIFIIFISVILALFEIQIEGKNGWAKNLPTWKIPNPFYKVINWKYLTDYHFYLWTFLLLVFQLPFFFGMKFNPKNEIILLETLFLTFILEDFLWFILNPKWGFKKIL